MFCFDDPGFVYGAKKGKILNMFIDDLSLPQRDQYGTQEVNEVSETLHIILSILALLFEHIF